MNIKEKSFSFFSNHLDPVKPILLGLSGGADSMALLYLSLEWMKRNPCTLHLVHINHGWREESKRECEVLKELASRLSLPFHTIELAPAGYKGNLEAESRKERFAYFEKLATVLSAQAILLAHHADDQAETVFKRLLEVRDCTSLRAIMPVTRVQTLTVFRPLLAVSKDEIVAYLQEQGISYFDDPTNYDEKYLRARMRKTIFPALKKQFGKGFQANLSHLASDAERLSHYLDQQIAPYLAKMRESAWGIMLDQLPEQPYELQHLVKILIQERGGLLSHEQRALVCQLLLTKKANKEVKSKGVHLLCDRGILFWLNDVNCQLPEKQKLVFGSQTFGPYRIEVSYATGTEEPKNHWKELFLGTSLAIIPEGEYFISSKNEKKTTKILSKFFNEEKIPNFLAKRAPLIVDEQTGDCVVEDFLTGRQIAPCKGKAFVVRLYLI